MINDASAKSLRLLVFCSASIVKPYQFLPPFVSIASYSRLIVKELFPNISAVAALPIHLEGVPSSRHG
jgi:hypothetical protein